MEMPALQNTPVPATERCPIGKIVAKEAYYLREIGDEDADRLPRECFPEQLPKELKQVFKEVLENGKGWIRPGTYVGIVPFRCGICNAAHVVAIYPKGAPSHTEPNEKELLNALGRFLDLLLFASDFDEKEEIPQDAGWRAISHGERFVAMLGVVFTLRLHELCRKDFRLYYRAEKDELKSRIRGRPDLVRHAINVIRGRGTYVPCRWEEFTPDHLDNRILNSARLYLLGLGSYRPGKFLVKAFRQLREVDSYFADVEEGSISPVDFRMTKLGRISSYYRITLQCAEWVLCGARALKTDQPMRPFVFDTASLFEKFAKRIIDETAASRNGWRSDHNPSALLMKSPVERRCVPDGLIKDTPIGKIVFDAKYKRVLEMAEDPNAISIEDLGVKMSPSDLYQMYYYMRSLDARLGVFFIPVWKETSKPEPVLIWPKSHPALYGKSPIGLRENEDHQVLFMGLNLLCHPRDVLNEAKEKLAHLVEQYQPLLKAS